MIELTSGAQFEVDHPEQTDERVLATQVPFGTMVIGDEIKVRIFCTRPMELENARRVFGTMTSYLAAVRRTRCECDRGWELYEDEDGYVK